EHPGQRQVARTLDLLQDQMRGHRAVLDQGFRATRNQRVGVVAQRDLRPGDVIEVAAGGRLPADGQLLSPFASFDESALTGESVPVERQAGERVAAGAT
ncbi:copper-transporting ATPase, partial [Pseudomonas aeruginosa]|nr:copper-transporting ATPase [Pseudomonas aeruginosa]